MKKFASFLIVILLISVFSPSISLAANNGDKGNTPRGQEVRPDDNNGINGLFLSLQAYFFGSPSQKENPGKKTGKNDKNDDPSFTEEGVGGCRGVGGCGGWR